MKTGWRVSKTSWTKPFNAMYKRRLLGDDNPSLVSIAMIPTIYADEARLELWLTS
jgi:hypothetical protein